MADIHINIGSNQNRKHNISGAISALQLVFSEVVLSSLFESPAEGFEGDDFYNVGVNASTDMSIVDVLGILKDIEKQYGRDRTQPKFSSREIDLDLVFFDDIIDTNNNLPRDDILKYAFVLAPLAQLNPNIFHPLENQSYHQLWHAFQINNTFELTQYNVEIITQ